MIPALTFAGRRVAVFGLGRSGNATCQSLLAGGAEVLAWDESEQSRAAAAAEGIGLVDLNAADWSAIDALVLAPGVPLTHPAPHWTVNRASAAGVEIIGDIEIFARERQRLAPDAPFIAITGTNGKSTTTALIAHVLSSLGHDTQMGGNIGVPILSLEPPARDRYHVIEMSSYQIDLTPTLDPSVGILLNISPDHIDRHGTFENYAEVKSRLPRSASTAVVGIDDAPAASIAAELVSANHDVVRLSARSKLPSGYYLDEGRIYNAQDGTRGVVTVLDGIATLRGRHNAQNVMATLAALEAFGIRAADVAPTLRTFPGLAHRMEIVGRVGNVGFINDSKATNAESAAVALASFDADIFWICGGRAKEGGVTELAPYFDRITRAYLIGESEEDFAATLDGRLEVARCGTLEIAVAAAARDAAASAGPEPVVLLAPACASFDQYPSFEARGNHFRDIIAALPNVELPGAVN